MTACLHKSCVCNCVVKVLSINIKCLASFEYCIYGLRWVLWERTRRCGHTQSSTCSLQMCCLVLFKVRVHEYSYRHNDKVYILMTPTFSSCTVPFSQNHYLQNGLRVMYGLFYIRLINTFGQKKVSDGRTREPQYAFTS
jgi:hypothetical protein